MQISNGKVESIKLSLKKIKHHSQNVTLSFPKQDCPSQKDLIKAARMSNCPNERCPQCPNC
jgi:hypothetical protein